MNKIQWAENVESMWVKLSVTALTERLTYFRVTKLSKEDERESLIVRIKFLAGERSSLFAWILWQIDWESNSTTKTRSQCWTQINVLNNRSCLHCSKTEDSWRGCATTTLTVHELSLITTPIFVWASETAALTLIFIKSFERAF